MERTIRELLSECEAEARRQGDFEGGWELTRHDMEWITDQLGRKPTRDEWAAAGLRWVGDAHVAEEE